MVGTVRAPEGHSCTWRVVEKRRDGAGRLWSRDECEHGWTGGWFLPDLTVAECPWPDPEGEP